jgi:pimeloyl-ACP methyl ester carboxylesterase
MNKARTLTSLGLSLATFATAVAVVVHRRFQQDLQHSSERIRSLKSQIRETSAGPVEYLTLGQGYPIILAHGIMGGFDQGLVEAGHNCRGFQSILVSRFGYLGSPLPEHASPALQADSYAALLDALGINQAAMLGISSGGPSAIQFALRHADRCSALLLLSSRGPRSAPLPPKWAFNILAKSNFVMWALKTYFRSTLYSMLVPKQILAALTAEKQQHLVEIAETLLPVKPRSAGILFDAYVTNPDIDHYPFEQITVPTLVLHAKDDPLSSFRSVRTMAARIPGARLVSFEQGGHINLGNEQKAAEEITTFLHQHNISRLSPN